MREKPESNIEVDEITLPAIPDSIPELINFIFLHLNELYLDSKKIREISLAVEEALQNIICFACPDGKGEISIIFNVHNSGDLIIEIKDTGIAFNMLLAETFTELDNIFEPGEKPSNRMIKKTIKNIEYWRGKKKNTLIFTIPHSTTDIN